MHTEKQAQARNLYFQTGLSKTQIADLLNISRRSLHYWIRENNWDRLKKSATHLPAMLAENCYMIFDQFTKHMLSENRIMRPITHQEADTMYKLTLTIKKLKNHSTLNESMEMLAHFMERINKKSPELANLVMPFVNDFIEENAQINIHRLKPAYLNEQGFIPVPDHNNPDESRLAEIAEIQKDTADLDAWQQEQENTSIEPLIEAFRKREENAQAENLTAPLEEPASSTLPPAPVMVSPSNHAPVMVSPSNHAPAVVSPSNHKKRMTFNEMLEACNGDELALHEMIDKMDELSDEEVARRRALLEFGNTITQKYKQKPAA